MNNLIKILNSMKRQVKEAKESLKRDPDHDAMWNHATPDILNPYISHIEDLIEKERQNG